MGIRKLFPKETRWDPTPAQEEAALRLAASGGGFARSNLDGTTELRTMERGALRRYVIGENGETALVESRAALPGYVWSDRLGLTGMLMCFAGAAVGIGGGKLGPEMLGIVGMIALLTGLATFFAGTMIWGKAFKRVAPPPGERWMRVGGSDH